MVVWKSSDLGKAMDILTNILLIVLVVVLGILFLGALAWGMTDIKGMSKQIGLWSKGLFRSLYYRLRIFDLIKVYEEFKHKQVFKKLRGRKVRITKQSSTIKRSIWIFVIAIVTVVFGYSILDCLGQANGCAGLSVLKITTLNDKVFSTAVILLIYSPILFLIWLYRDVNKLKEIEQQRKDNNLKEFQKLQEWATGNIADRFYEAESGSTVKKVKDESIALQISALHMLRDYLKGEYGDSFKRGAFEIFVSVLRAQHKKIIDKLDPDGTDKYLTFDKIHNEVNSDELTKQVNAIVVEDYFSFILDHDFSLHNLSLVGVCFPTIMFMSKSSYRQLSFHSCDFRGVSLSGHFHGMNFSNSDFRGANLNMAEFNGCSFSNSKFKGAILASSRFRGANFEGANLQGVLGKGAQLEGASFIRADLRGSDFSKAIFHAAIFYDANLIGANLEGAELQASYLMGAKFSATNVEGVNFSGVISKEFTGWVINEKFKKVIMDSVGKKGELSGLLLKLSPADVLDTKNVLEKIKRDVWDHKMSKFFENSWITKAIPMVSENNDLEFKRVDLDSIYTKEEADVWLKNYRQFLEKVRPQGSVRRPSS